VLMVVTVAAAAAAMAAQLTNVQYLKVQAALLANELSYDSELNTVKITNNNTTFMCTFSTDMYFQVKLCIANSFLYKYDDDDELKYLPGHSNCC